MIPCAVNWSSGKDSALALYHILQSKEYSVCKLVTNVNSDYQRVSMHGLHESLLDAQTKAIDLPLQKVNFTGEVSMKSYTARMQQHARELIDEGIGHTVYGDIFLEDLKTYRDQIHQSLDIQLIYPLWNRNSEDLIREFIDLGFKAVIVCVSAKLLDASYLGQTIDHDFINNLPKAVDPCGENGEFHTFVYDGPIFQRPVYFKLGEKVLRDYSTENKDQPPSWDQAFWYQDLIAQ